MTQLQDGRAEREFFLALPFVLFRLPTDWLRPTHFGGGLFVLLQQIKR